MRTIMPAVADPIHFPEGDHAKRGDKIQVRSAACDARIMPTMCNSNWRQNALRNFSFEDGIKIGSIANIPSVQQTEGEL